MDRIKLNHWFIKNNELSISLFRYCINIKILFNDEFVFYQLTVIDSQRYEIIFNFYTLEDAISFTENVITSCKTNEEIINSYQEMFTQNKFKKKIK